MKKLEVVVSKHCSVDPFHVETQPTGTSWGSHSCWKSLLHAKLVARIILREYPKLPVRIKHYTGGPPQIGK